MAVISFVAQWPERSYRCAYFFMIYMMCVSILKLEYENTSIKLYHYELRGYVEYPGV